MVTSYYNCTRFSYINLFLNSNYILKMKTLCSPFTVTGPLLVCPPNPPPHYSLFLRKKEPEKLENLNRIEDKEPVSGHSMLDLLAFFQWVRAKSTYRKLIFMSSHPLAS